jgi:hypothetical protein
VFWARVRGVRRRGRRGVGRIVVAEVGGWGWVEDGLEKGAGDIGELGVGLLLYRWKTRGGSDVSRCLSK